MGYHDRDLKRIATATSTTAAGSKTAQQWRSAHAWKLPFALAPNPTTWKAVFWRSRYYVGIKVDSSPIFLIITGFKSYHCFFFSLYQESIRGFWFSSKYVLNSLRFLSLRFRSPTECALAAEKPRQKKQRLDENRKHDC